ncbi:MAG: hypothetical protein M8364_16675 [Methylobacter sp.]|uniref:Mor transcription activator family protein n=1 Tax=Methylobacter sp. TaxID=2051955 RepID=UPI0025868576|nr:Mor transcription activator family protein [Methylobacter sp.]MCL7422527.1 hypothetical protein [Methylobacter sp.]
MAEARSQTRRERRDAMTDLPRHLLPASLLLIAEYCGETTMWAIWSEYGGGHLSVPERATPEHSLSQLLGYAAARKFCQAFGGELLNIPKAAAAKRAVRNECIRRDRRNGMGHFALCRKYGLTERQIIAICQAGEPKAFNFDLFD